MGMNRPSARPRGRFSSQDRRSATTCASLALEAVSLNFLALRGREAATLFAERWSISADEKGEYDNIGFRYRGHVITGPDGAFRFRTIVPALYSGRTRHYHVKVQVPGSRLLTTQLYFPNEPANSRDGLFQRELLMRVTDAGEGLAGRFDFILNIR